MSISGDIGYVKGVLEGTGIRTTDEKIKECSEKALAAMGRIEAWILAQPHYVIAVDEGQVSGDKTVAVAGHFKDGKLFITDIVTKERA